MTRLYNLAIRLYGLGITLAAVFNPKARKWVQGRVDWKEWIIQNVPATDRIIWVHAASQGEMEQGIPIVRKLRRDYPDRKILITFFSPSGYENFQNDDLADYVLYLPLDTRNNAEEFLTLISPELAFFIKYEMWPNFYRQITEMEIPLILAPAIFRPDQFLFKKPFRRLFLSVLKKVDRIMVQDERSKELLEKEGFDNVSVVGDTRFDRAQEIAETNFISDKIEQFKDNYVTIVVGSSHKPEEKIIYKVLDKYPEIKVLLAPHDVGKTNIDRLRSYFKTFRPVLYSQKVKSYQNSRIMIVNTMGMLSKIYRYGELAFVGGAFGKGVHSTIEPVVYRIPVAFGPRHQKFIEPAEMLEREIGFEIRNHMQLIQLAREIDLKEDFRNDLKTKIEAYLETKTGSVEKIVKGIEELMIQ